MEDIVDADKERHKSSPSTTKGDVVRGYFKEVRPYLAKIDINQKYLAVILRSNTIPECNDLRNVFKEGGDINVRVGSEYIFCGFRYFSCELASREEFKRRLQQMEVYSGTKRYKTEFRYN